MKKAYDAAYNAVSTHLWIFALGGSGFWLLSLIGWENLRWFFQEVILKNPW